MTIRPTILTVLSVVGLLMFVQSNAAAQDRETPVEPEPSLTGSQFDCSYLTRTFAPSASFAADPDVVVTIKNGTTARTVIFQYSAESNVTGAGGHLDIRYSIDGGAFSLIGPEVYTADAAPSTRTAVAVLPMPSGNHTIQPGFKYTGPAGTVGRINFRCFTVEGRTK